MNKKVLVSLIPIVIFATDCSGGSNGSGLAFSFDLSTE